MFAVIKWIERSDHDQRLLYMNKLKPKPKSEPPEIDKAQRIKHHQRPAKPNELNSTSKPYPPPTRPTITRCHPIIAYYQTEKPTNDHPIV